MIKKIKIHEFFDVSSDEQKALIKENNRISYNHFCNLEQQFFVECNDQESLNILCDKEIYFKDLKLKKNNLCFDLIEKKLKKLQNKIKND